ncbi:MAG TPA: hypothetical protein VFW15_06130 [Thermoanaerobaculia bacterium]|nr:hypothetical protein [Thermoanaerobaculia bacterium]
MTPAGWLLLGAAAILVAFFLVPRLLIGRAQDLLAKRTMASEGRSLKLLTRAELVTGRFQRVPGLLAWRDDVLAFQGIDGHTVAVPPSRIRKIVTADRLASGRLLVKLEILRLTDADGEELEFVVGRRSADAWRQLLGEWSVRERQAAAAPDIVTPGRKS